MDSKSRCLILILFLLGCWIFPSSFGTLEAATVPVSIGDNFFSPSSVAANVNDTITWTWTGASSHSSTSNAGDTTTWDSGIVGNGSVFSKQFTAAGSFPYHCNVHASQLGTVTVQAANAPPSVTITNPANGAVISAPAAFTLGASASDGDGTKPCSCRSRARSWRRSAVALAHPARRGVARPLGGLVSAL